MTVASARLLRQSSNHLPIYRLNVALSTIVTTTSSGDPYKTSLREGRQIDLPQATKILEEIVMVVVLVMWVRVPLDSPLSLIGNPLPNVEGQSH